MSKQEGSLGRDPINAAGEGDTLGVCALLAGGAAVDFTDNVRWTPLMMAVAAGHTTTVDLLVEAGASIDACARGQTALTLATENNHTEIAEFLKEATAGSGRLRPEKRTRQSQSNALSLSVMGRSPT